MKYALIIFALLLLPLGLAETFEQDTTFKNNEITYTFKQGISVNDFDITRNGIVINGNHQLVFFVNGGTLNVTFYEWSPNSNLIGLVSNVEQTLSFKITKDGKKQYIQSGDSFHIDSFPLKETEQKVSYILYNNGNTFDDSVVRTIQKDKWYQVKLLDLEYNVEEDENGIISSDTFGVSYFGIGLFVIFLGGLIWLIRKF